MSDLTPHERTAAALARSSDRVAALLRERQELRDELVAAGTAIRELRAEGRLHVELDRQTDDGR